jgi:hypothetical protein
MPRTIEVYLEAAKRRTFACAYEWPGWCRSGRDEDAALEALAAYGARYRAAIGPRRFGFTAPSDRSSLEVVERLAGNATTDFGAPAVEPARDHRPVKGSEAKRLVEVLAACWAMFDRAAKAASGVELRKGPRGGGRALDAIVDHLVGADEAYLRSLGGRYRRPDAADQRAAIEGVRRAILAEFRSQARGEPPSRTPRSGTLWTPRYAVRRMAWHALDHAWEIEDRASGPR